MNIRKNKINMTINLKNAGGLLVTTLQKKVSGISALSLLLFTIVLQRHFK
jgi:hypothetical protein